MTNNINQFFDSNIKATIIADSINTQGSRITTFEVEYPRFILPEMNTHRLFSRNYSSSRAIPVSKMIEQLKQKHYTPKRFGINQSGMTSREYYDTNSSEHTAAKNRWEEAFNNAIHTAEAMNELNIHKQWINRILEPFQYVKGIITSTDYNNFFALRIHPDAQPEIYEIAYKMREEYYNNSPFDVSNIMEYDVWHLPYFVYNVESKNYMNIISGELHTEDEALKISVAMCAMVSYRKEDTSLETAERIIDKLWNTVTPHASPFEHQAISVDVNPFTGGFSQKGVTHKTANGNYMSSNLSEWVSYRNMLNKGGSNVNSFHR